MGDEPLKSTSKMRISSFVFPFRKFMLPKRIGVNISTNSLLILSEDVGRLTVQRFVAQIVYSHP